ncbi:MAG: DUF3097 family protein [Ancrocorticia sp.]|uniref:DUF3097 family protein n=1 Tax=Ancrocorticia sp. TaxID=2593684 RepID=UPI003F90B5C8
MFSDPYGRDVLSDDPHRAPESLIVHATAGLIIEDVQSGFVGEIIKVGRVAGSWQFQLEDRRGVRRSFPMGRGYWIEGKPVELVAPAPRPKKSERAINAAGSLHVARRARTARESRIWVEGKHDAELVAKVWGEDLALEGIVVEELLGVDRLEEMIVQFQPSETRRAGILVDHLVSGSKESRIAERFAHLPGVLILGHPYVDVWQAIKPAAVGISKWPSVPRGEDIKEGTLRRLGLPHESAADIGRGWARILSNVRSYKDLESSLLGRMEELIDFLTEPEAR